MSSPWRPWEKFIERDGRVVRKPEPKITPGIRQVLETEPAPRPPAFSKRVTYGNGNTIHGTGTIDIVLDQDGQVKQVWYRCRELPFTVTRSDYDPGEFNPSEIFIEEITYLYTAPEDDE